MEEGFVLGDYVFAKLIGKGGMGAVYRAHQTSLDRFVAIKVLSPELCANPEFVDRFLREARAAARLNHPHIVSLFDAGVSDNILLTEEGHAKVGDLGLAKRMDGEGDLALTSTGAAMGTPYYISPEQINGLKDIDGRADIYSLGITLYHLLSGKPPFSGRSAGKIISQHLTEEPPPLEAPAPGISQATVDLVKAMTASPAVSSGSATGPVTLQPDANANAPKLTPRQPQGCVRLLERRARKSRDHEGDREDEKQGRWL